jgi:glycosyltransferase involved in cell wall biosynthesis
LVAQEVEGFMSEPLVSIVIPVFQGMPHLTALIESLKAQTYPHIEITAAVTPTGDGSEDRLRESGITVIETPIGTRAAENWTIATQAATGEFTKLICQDDLLYPNAIEQQVRDLQTNSTVVMAVAQRDIIDSQGKILFRNRGLSGVQGNLASGSEVLRKSYLYGGNIFGEPLAVLFRTSVLKSVMPWRDDNPLMLDVNTYSLAAPLGGIALRHESVGAFRVSGQSWSTHLARKQLNQTKTWQQEYEAAHTTSTRDRMRATVGRHIQTNTRRAAYTYLSLRGAL